MRATPPLLSLEYGATVYFRGKIYVISQESDDLCTVVLRDIATGKYTQAPVSELSATQDPIVENSSDLEEFAEVDLLEAKRKYEIIQPLLNNPERCKQDVISVAAKAGVNAVTLYRWMKLFQTTGRVSVLIRKSRDDIGSKTLSEQVEKIVEDAINSTFLTAQKSRASKVIEKVKRACAKLELQPPHPNTIRNRIRRIDAYKKIRARDGNKAARDAFVQIKGEFPGADFPLAVVQVDHTPADLIVVDDDKRLPIGRPWITLLIDVFSRMVLGFYISLDPPGNLSLGLCLSQAFLPKEKWLGRFKIESAWPCWGIPRTIHADNAKEFRGEMLKLACQEYGADLEWRPVATPRYGGHIERLLGTLNHKIHNSLPGTTFSNPVEKGEYSADQHSALTLSEFEEWFSILCIDVYHNEEHSALGMSPLDKWKQGVLGSSGKPGTGLPPRISDELKLKLDLMPFDLRTVQHTGIVWDLVHYQHDVLRRWIKAADPQHPKHHRKFLCRRDPRDISVIWFYDPEVKQYYAIPYRDTSHPAISLWELKAAREFSEKENPAAKIDETRIFMALDRMDAIQSNAVKLTKRARRDIQRKKVGMKKSQEHVPRAMPTPEAKTEDTVPEQRPRRAIRTFDVEDL